jgi:hypothetical protein
MSEELGPNGIIRDLITTGAHQNVVKLAHILRESYMRRLADSLSWAELKECIAMADRVANTTTRTAPPMPEPPEELEITCIEPEK